ncbi:MAG TPA: FYDLN acid domain-containing protein [Thermoanaerobaculia bacterium]|nr:FYDLN acid domain-containing protein [Thermoanaerobaculia bacterium]
MPDLGRKYTCYSCHTKFYDLGKPVPLCPKCGADQRDAEDAAPVTTHRGRSRVVEEPPEEEFPEPETAPAAESEEEDIIPEPEHEEPADGEAEEEEY